MAAAGIAVYGNCANAVPAGCRSKKRLVRRSTKADLPSWLCHHFVSCHAIYLLLLLCLPYIQLNSLLISVSSNGRTRIRHRIQSGATEEDNNNNNNNNNNASTIIHIEYTGQTDEPPTLMQHLPTVHRIWVHVRYYCMAALPLGRSIPTILQRGMYTDKGSSPSTHTRECRGTASKLRILSNRATPERTYTLLRYQSLVTRDQYVVA